MNHNPFSSYLKKAILFVTVLVVVLGLTFTPGDTPALADPPEPYLVKDIFPGPNSSKDWQFNDVEMTNVDGILYFRARNGVHGMELWKSDGTEAGTVMVKDIYPGSGELDPFPSRLTNVDGVLFFIANDGIHGWELWKSDGTEAGTVMVKDIYLGSGDPYGPEWLTNVDGVLFFSADDGVHGYELWKSDGTEAGTVMVKDIYPGKGGGCGELTDLSGILFFSFIEEGFYELWKSDSTEAGTVLVKNISASKLTNVNGTLFFYGWDYWDYVSRHALWKSDGTEAGTVLVKEISDLGEPTAVNSTLFFINYDSVHGTELWKSDGTEAGTMMVKDILPGSDGFIFTANLSDINGTLFFRGPSGGLWKSDGTETGTVVVADINIYGNLTDIDGTIFLTVGENNHGYELWKSDGTDIGTVLVKDINPGTGDSYPNNYINVNGTLFFQADDGVHGYELWALDLREKLSIFLPLVTR